MLLQREVFQRAPSSVGDGWRVGHRARIRSLAIEMARAHTGRKKVLSLLGASSPHPDDVDIRIVSPLKISALCRALAESEERISAILTGPVECDSLVFRRYMKRVRELASAEGAVLIWDDGHPGPSVEALGIYPDLSCLGWPEDTDQAMLRGRCDILKGLAL